MRLVCISWLAVSNFSKIKSSTQKLGDSYFLWWDSYPNFQNNKLAINRNDALSMMRPLWVLSDSSESNESISFSLGNGDLFFSWVECWVWFWCNFKLLSFSNYESYEFWYFFSRFCEGFILRKLCSRSFLLLIKTIKDYKL